MTGAPASQGANVGFPSLFTVIEWMNGRLDVCFSFLFKCSKREIMGMSVCSISDNKNKIKMSL